MRKLLKCTSSHSHSKVKTFQSLKYLPSQLACLSNRLTSIILITDDLSTVFGLLYQTYNLTALGRETTRKVRKHSLHFWMNWTI